MREIKFRGLPTCDRDELNCINFDHDGNFVVGFYEDGYIIGEIADVDDDYINPEFWVAVDRNTVGQYTGLLDKNGREIYEGDIVRVVGITDPDMKWVVTWANASWELHHVLGGKYMTPMRLATTGIPIKVIGNAYENPGLLEAEK